MKLARRAFLGRLLLAPAVVRASSIMPVFRVRPILWGDGIHDDAPALQAMIDEASDMLSLTNSMHLVRKTLRIPPLLQVVISHVTLIGEQELGTPMLEFASDSCGLVSNCRFPNGLRRAGLSERGA